MGFPVNIDELISGGIVESDRIEYKEGFDPLKLMHSICAFANDINNYGGGYILLGISAPKGVPVLPPKGLVKEQIDSFQRKLIELQNKIKPVVQVVCSPEKISGKYILAIWVPGGEARPYEAPEADVAKTRMQYYVRRHSSTVRTNANERQRLLELSTKIPFDDRVNHSADITDISKDILREFGCPTVTVLNAQPQNAIVNEPVMVYYNVYPADDEDVDWVNVSPTPDANGVIYFDSPGNEAVSITSVEWYFIDSGNPGDPNVFFGPRSFPVTVDADIDIVSGNQQNVSEGGQANQLVAYLNDYYGDPVPNVAASFSGQVNNSSTQSDASGNITADLITDTAGSYTITATGAFVFMPAIFNEIVYGVTITSIVPQDLPSGSGQASALTFQVTPNNYVPNSISISANDQLCSPAGGINYKNGIGNTSLVEGVDIANLGYNYITVQVDDAGSNGSDFIYIYGISVSLAPSYLLLDINGCITQNLVGQITCYFGDAQITNGSISVNQQQNVAAASSNGPNQVTQQNSSIKPMDQNANQIFNITPTGNVTTSITNIPDADNITYEVIKSVGDPQVLNTYPIILSTSITMQYMGAVTTFTKTSTNQEVQFIPTTKHSAPDGSGTTRSTIGVAETEYLQLKVNESFQTCYWSLQSDPNNGTINFISNNPTPLAQFNIYQYGDYVINAKLFSAGQVFTEAIHVQSPLNRILNSNSNTPISLNDIPGYVESPSVGTLIGADANFAVVIQPTNVCFDEAIFEEERSCSKNWPNGTTYNYTSAYKFPQNKIQSNSYTDQLSAVYILVATGTATVTITTGTSTSTTLTTIYSQQLPPKTYLANQTFNLPIQIAYDVIGSSGNKFSTNWCDFHIRNYDANGLSWNVIQSNGNAIGDSSQPPNRKQGLWIPNGGQ